MLILLNSSTVVEESRDADTNCCRYSLGLAPHTLRKTRAKCCWLLKPQATATSNTRISAARNSSLARSTLRATQTGADFGPLTGGTSVRSGLRSSPLHLPFDQGSNRAPSRRAQVPQLSANERESARHDISGWAPGRIIAQSRIR